MINIRQQYIVKTEMSTPKQLEEKMQMSSSFKKQMHKAQENYSLITQQAHYSDLSKIAKNMVGKFETERSPIELIFFYGAYQPSDKKLFDKMLMFFVTQFPKPRSPYAIIYFNDEENSGNKFTDFKNFFTMLPLDYFLMLERIYLMKPSFKNKASKLLSFHTITKYVNYKTSEVQTIEQLCEYLGLNLEEVFRYLPMKVRDSFQAQQIQLKSSNTSHPGFGNALQKIIFSASSSQHNPKPVQKQELKKRDIDEYEKGERGVPQVLELLIFYFKQNPEGLKQQGLFRKSVNIEQQTQLMACLANQDYQCLQKITNPHVIANLIKRFFANLKTPVIPYKQFDKLMASNPLDVNKVSEAIKQIEAQNMTNLLSIMLLFQFLLKDVIPNSPMNKMTFQNISICFAPCLMWAEERSIKDIVYANKSVQAMIIMLQKFQTVFGNRKEQKKLYRSSYMLQKKKSLTENFIISSHVNQQQYGNLLGNRKTPNFNELIIKNTQSFLQVLGEEDQDTIDETHSMRQLPQSSYDKKTLTQSNMKYLKQSNKQLTEGSQQKRQEFKQLGKGMKKSEVSHDKSGQSSQLKSSQQKKETLQIPKPAKRGIFSSHIGRIEANKSVSSKKSEGSIKSIHSDV